MSSETISDFPPPFPQLILDNFLSCSLLPLLKPVLGAVPHVQIPHLPNKVQEGGLQVSRGGEPASPVKLSSLFGFVGVARLWFFRGLFVCLFFLDAGEKHFS